MPFRSPSFGPKFDSLESRRVLSSMAAKPMIADMTSSIREATAEIAIQNSDLDQMAMPVESTQFEALQGPIVQIPTRKIMPTVAISKRPNQQVTAPVPLKIDYGTEMNIGKDRINIGAVDWKNISVPEVQRMMKSADPQTSGVILNRIPKAIRRQIETDTNKRSEEKPIKLEEQDEALNQLIETDDLDFAFIDQPIINQSQSTIAEESTDAGSVAAGAAVAMVFAGKLAPLMPNVQEDQDPSGLKKFGKFMRTLWPLGKKK